MSKKHGFIGIFAHLYSLKSEFLLSNCQTQHLGKKLLIFAFKATQKIPKDLDLEQL
ncbi:hypothetical protein R7X80_00280 [Mesomycoplasma ovipneumoniae]|uniref:hypothetical protein n=1 Tax=Mesomycoplasma ovipneumoniae TaxID=29562 RepID=UPI0029641AB5|nr:hypothetical protein [Mesomycoplasma ovipneumoniae]MDW2930289.1 hypothetical protein [Mesomycoplasma ovipneumoniae]